MIGCYGLQHLITNLHLCLSPESFYASHHSSPISYLPVPSFLHPSPPLPVFFLQLSSPSNSALQNNFINMHQLVLSPELLFGDIEGINGGEFQHKPRVSLLTFRDDSEASAAFIRCPNSICCQGNRA